MAVDVFDTLMCNFIEAVKKQSFSVSDGTQNNSYRRQNAYYLLQTALKFSGKTNADNLRAKLTLSRNVLMEEIDKIASFLSYSANSGQTTQNAANMSIDEWRKCIKLLDKQEIDGDENSPAFGFFG
jgi:hypothetical protein